MSLKCFTYTVCSYFKCSDTLPSDIIICVDADKVIPDLRGDDTGFVTAQITSVVRGTSISCSSTWTYTICYDDAQLDTGVPDLLGTDVQGIVCEDCLAAWIRATIGTGESTVAFLGLKEGIYGDGSDGDLTVHNGEELWLPFPARNMFFNNLVIEPGGILHTYGTWTKNPEDSAPASNVFPPYLVKQRNNVPSSLVYQFPYTAFFCIRAKSAVINGTLSADGIDAATWQAGVGFDAMLPGPGGGWGNGGGGGYYDAYYSLFRKDGDAGARGLNYSGICGGVGGNGGDAYSPGSSGGFAGTSKNTDGSDPSYGADPVDYKVNKYLRELADWSFGVNFIASALVGGCGGGGGGGYKNVSDPSTSNLGGGGGTGGGTVYLAAKNITIGAAGKISAKGGNGADALIVNPAVPGGGGGGGGGGGFIYLIYESLLNSGTFDVSPGAKGLKAALVNTGQDGQDGQPGNVTKLNISTNTFDV